MTPFGIEPANFRFVSQHLNHCATAVTKYYNVMGPPSYMRSVVDRNVVMRRVTVQLRSITTCFDVRWSESGGSDVGLLDSAGRPTCTAEWFCSFALLNVLRGVLASYRGFCSKSCSLFTCSLDTRVLQKRVVDVVTIYRGIQSRAA